jgi:citrate lyase beta subunit
MYQSVLHPTLYSPATTEPHKILALANRIRENTGVWRMVLCTEDAIREDELPSALHNVRALLADMSSETPVAIFVRVRNPEVMAAVLDMPGAEKLTGFVVPKAAPESYSHYADQIVEHSSFRLMPILEAPQMIDRHFRESLRGVLTDQRYRSQIDCLRIGANDLMGRLGIRRDDKEFTVYDTPVGATIHDIINEFRGVAGFTITAPVFELYGDQYGELFRKEARQHVMNGLFGQTVINLVHLLPLRDMYSVKPDDLASAQSILESSSAVKGLNGRMDEHATHWKWAEMILERHRLFGRTDKVRRETRRDMFLMEAYTTPTNA